MRIQTEAHSSPSANLSGTKSNVKHFLKLDVFFAAVKLFSAHHSPRKYLTRLGDTKKEMKFQRNRTWRIL
jgi:hypothetical protein